MSDLRGLHELNQVLNAQCAAFEKQLVLEEEKTAVLVAGDTEALLRIMNAQQALIMQCRVLENQRSTLCANMEWATLTELIQSGTKCAVTLGPVYQSINATVGKLKKKNALNKKLLETRLATIRFMTCQLGISENINTYTKGVQVRA